MNRKQKRELARTPPEKQVALRPIVIGIPSGDEVKANFMLSMSAMSFYCGLKQIPLAFCNQKGSMLPKNRNNLVRDAKQLNATHILQIDSDITFPPHTLHRLLAHQKEVVGCTYARRSNPHDNLAVPLDRKPVYDAHGLTAVDRLPTGMLLIDMRVFEKIRKPYFRFPTVEATEEGPEGQIEGEDYYLCDAVRAAGYNVWLDVELSFDLTHWGEAGWRLKDEDGTNGPRFELVELQCSL